MIFSTFFGAKEFLKYIVKEITFANKISFKSCLKFSFFYILMFSLWFHWGVLKISNFGYIQVSERERG